MHRRDALFSLHALDVNTISVTTCIACMADTVMICSLLYNVHFSVFFFLVYLSRISSYSKRIYIHVVDVVVIAYLYCCVSCHCRVAIPCAQVTLETRRKKTIYFLFVFGSGSERRRRIRTKTPGVGTRSRTVYAAARLT